MEYIQPSDVGITPSDSPEEISAGFAAMVDSGLEIRVPACDDAWELSEPLIVKSHTRIVGAGWGKARFIPASDFGAGHALIEGDPAMATQAGAAELSGFSVEGFTGSIGTAPCAMNGINLWRNAALTDVRARGFNAGLALRGDHVSLRHVRSNNNFFNLLFDDAPVTLGNTTVFDCDLTGAFKASVGIAGSNVIDASYFAATHLGFSPIGIYRFGTNPSHPGINNTIFQNVSFEAIGNNAIRDDSTGGEPLTMAGAQFLQVGHSVSATYRLAGLDWDWTVDARTIADSEIGISRSPFASGAQGHYRLKDVIDENTLSLQIASGQSMPVIGGSANGITFRRSNGGTGFYAKALTAVTAKEAVESTFGFPLQVKRNGTDNRAYAGQALLSAAVNANVPVQNHGRAPFKNGTTAIPNGGVTLKLNGVKLTSAGTTTVVGASARDVPANGEGEVVLN